MFFAHSQAIIFGRHLDTAKRMLDFDFLSGRSPSVAGFVDFSAKKISFVKIFFGEREMLIPIFPDFKSIPKNENLDTFLNFASHRSAAEITKQALEANIFKNIVIIAEGIPERQIREIIALNAQKYQARIIGPATAGAISAGAFRLGNAGGSLDSIVRSRLFRPGSVGFVSRSGGMSNEMYRVISSRTDGIHTGVALGGDRFLGSLFSDIILEYENNSEIDMMVMLGEVGGRDELEIAKMLESGKITKPIVAYVTGSLAEKLESEVQFGHAGAKANANEETATFKNNALRAAGAIVPVNYRDFGDAIASTFREKFPYKIPLNHEIPDEIYQKIQILKSQNSTHFTSTISDERGDELLYNGKKISDFVDSGSIARVIGHLWLKKELPLSALAFLNAVIILLADHGPAVSGATNTIISARAGKDVLSSVVSGLLTIGPRFGGAIDGAAKYFFEALKNNETPEEFVEKMKKNYMPIPGIGHKVKSKFSPDKRCEILKNLSRPIKSQKYLNFALSVEAITLEKKPNLILNVDGHIAAIFLDIFTEMGMSEKEIEMYIDAGIFNGLFILSRTIGFIGHAIDQKRLGEGLYRTPWENIFYDN